MSCIAYASFIHATLFSTHSRSYLVCHRVTSRLFKEKLCSGMMRNMGQDKDNSTLAGSIIFPNQEKITFVVTSTLIDRSCAETKQNNKRRPEQLEHKSGRGSFDTTGRTTLLVQPLYIIQIHLILYNTFESRKPSIVTRVDCVVVEEKLVLETASYGLVGCTPQMHH